jgi:hypothetical protein
MLKLTIAAQPDGVSCGPSSLHALYHYFGDTITLAQTIGEVSYLETGGTLGVLLGCHALERGYRATLHSVNIQVLDPTWVSGSRENLAAKLRLQEQRNNDPKIKMTSAAYGRFLEGGGELIFGEVSFGTLSSYFDAKLPVLSGLSATYLYKNMRDYTGEKQQVIYDEWRGAPSGHFVVLRGCNKKKREVHVADPYTPQPLSVDRYYSLSFSHWLHAHLLGIITYDAELLVIQKRDTRLPLFSV